MIYKIATDEPFLIGDSHGVNYASMVIQKVVPQNSCAIHVGDVGLGFGINGLDRAHSNLQDLNNACEEKNIDLFLIRGNHDNPDVWKLENLSRITLLNTGDLIKSPSKTILIACGGISVDRCTRTINIDYWPDEVTEELQEIPAADILISHDCPEYFNHPTETLPQNFGYYTVKDKRLMDDCRVQRQRMSKILEVSGAQEIYYGHFHNSERKTVNGVFGRCLDINETHRLNFKGGVEE